MPIRPLALAALVALPLAAPGLVSAGSHEAAARQVLSVEAPDGGNLGGPGLALLKVMDLDRDAAKGFSDADLMALEQVEVPSNLPGDAEAKVTFSGPRLSAVMEAAGAAGKAAFPTALDGYQVEIAWEDIEAHQPILATHADGRPLAIGGIGPSMIVFPAIEDSETAQRLDGARVWAVFHIATE